MVNASLNWASIVGIALAVCGAGLYFLRSFKPALARDYDVFFAAIGLLCGGILFFQGWRLDPILQFGQFLLAATTVFFAYESVRLRGVATDQARRSSYFDEEPLPARMPSSDFRPDEEDSYDQFEESLPLRRRFVGQQNPDNSSEGNNSYRPRRSTRAAIPEQAASRSNRSRSDQNSWDTNSEKARRMARFGSEDEELNNKPSFGQRRNLRQDQRRGTRPSANKQPSSRRRGIDNDSRSNASINYSSSGSPGVPQGSPIRAEAEDAAFRPARSRPLRSEGTKPRATRSSEGVSPRSSASSPERTSQRRPRDNSSRFDD